MKDVKTLLAIAAAIVIIKRLADGKPTCVRFGPIKACNY